MGMTEKEERIDNFMKTEVKEIPFNGSTLLGIKDQNGQVWLAIRKTCADIGLSDGQARRQLANLKNDLIFKKAITNLRYPSNGGEQETTCINEKFVTLWLAKISLTPTMQKKNPEAVQKLLVYQLEAANVLHKAFYETDEQKDTFHSKFGLEGRIEGMQVQINNMENMLCEQMEKLDSVMENMTLSTRQQQKLYKAAKDRINYLLGGAHSKEYKEKSKSYFINLWNNFKEKYSTGSYKDLNPKYYDEAFDFIADWEYIEA